MKKQASIEVGKSLGLKDRDIIINDHIDIYS
jgi:hypothetical protein